MLVCMRTTIVLPDPLFKRAKKYAKLNDKYLSDFVAEALAERLAREEQSLREPRAVYKVSPRSSMGKALVDVSDRDALHGILDET